MHSTKIYNYMYQALSTEIQFWYNIYFWLANKAEHTGICNVIQEIKDVYLPPSGGSHPLQPFVAIN